MPEENTNNGLRKTAAFIALVVAFIVGGLKIAGWLATGSIALLTSAVDGLVDAAASFATYVGVRYAERPPDHNHRFGHGKGEAIAAFTQALLLAGAAVVLLVESIQRLFVPITLASLDIGVGVIIGSLIAAAILVAMQGWVVKKTGSTAIAADRAHYVTDVAVNVAVLAALAVTKFTGWERADPVFASLISGYMLWNAKHIASEALMQLLDRELEEKDRTRIKQTVLACPGVKNVHDLRTRYAGDRSFVEFHLEVDGHITVDEGHTIGDNAEAAVVKLLDGTVEVTCHLEPFGIDDERLDNRVKKHKD